jgi:hypothetical protein
MAAIIESTIGVTGDYTTIASWISDKVGDFVGNDEIHKGILIDNKNYDISTSISITGATTDSTHYWWLTTEESVRHTGKEGTGARIRSTSDLAVVLTVSDDAIIEYMEFDGNSNGTDSGIVINNGGYCKINGCIIHDVRSGLDSSGVKVSGSGHTLEIWNNLIYNISSIDLASIQYGIFIAVADQSAMYIYNNTINDIGYEKGYAIFNGENAYVGIDDNDDLSFGDGTDDSPFSISAWININTGSSYQGIAGKYNAAGYNREYYFVIDNNNKLLFFLLQESPLAILKVTSDNTIQLNEWLHVCGTYDGESSDTSFVLYESMDNLSYFFNIGCIEIGNANFDGKMYDARIHSKELSESEIESIMNGELSGNEIVHYKLESDVLDYGPNELDGQNIDVTFQTCYGIYLNTFITCGYNRNNTVIRVGGNTTSKCFDNFDGWTSSNNVSSDDTATGDNSFINETANNLFKDHLNDDYSLKLSSVAYNAGYDLSAYFTNDLAGSSRPFGEHWDIGSLEFLSVSDRIKITEMDTKNLLKIDTYVVDVLGE